MEKKHEQTHGIGDRARPTPSQRSADHGRRLSQSLVAQHTVTQDDDVSLPMRDGIDLLADIHRPAKVLPGPHCRFSLSKANTERGRALGLGRSRRQRFLGAARLCPCDRQLARHGGLGRTLSPNHAPRIAAINFVVPTIGFDLLIT